MTARMREDEYEALIARQKPSGVKKWQALGRLPKGTMNKTEAEYARELDRQQALGLILGYKFHPMRIRLADNTYYEVDFLVMHADQSLCIHETKGGYTSDKGQLKIKLVAEVMPWFGMLKVIKQAKKNGGGWLVEDYSRGQSVSKTQTDESDSQ